MKKRANPFLMHQLVIILLKFKNIDCLETKYNFRNLRFPSPKTSEILRWMASFCLIAMEEIMACVGGNEVIYVFTEASKNKCPWKMGNRVFHANLSSGFGNQRCHFLAGARKTYRGCFLTTLLTVSCLYSNLWEILATGLLREEHFKKAVLNLICWHRMNEQWRQKFVSKYWLLGIANENFRHAKT